MSEISHTLLVDQIYEKIKEEVLYKRLVPGEKINPRAISESYNISVTPVKQALNRMISEGLVKSIPRRGMIVRPLSNQELHESFEVRRMIEIYCIPFILKMAEDNPNFISQLEQTLVEFEQSIPEADATGNHLKQNNLDARFHALLVSTTNNSRLCELYDSVGTHLTIFYLYGRRNRKRFEDTLSEHKSILEAIKSGEECKLKAAINSHIDNVLADYQQSLANKHVVNPAS